MTTNPWFFVALALGLGLIGLSSYLAWRGSKRPSDHHYMFGNKMGGTYFWVGVLVLVIACMIYRR